jgi:hypothetical protein
VVAEVAVQGHQRHCRRGRRHHLVTVIVTRDRASTLQGGVEVE